MKEKFYDTLLSVLKTDSRFFSSDGDFLRNAVYEAAMNLDENLIKILLDNPVTKERFFKDVNGICVFDKVEFTWTINNKELLPDSYTRFKNKIGLVDSNGDLISSSDKVELVFPYKDCVLEGGQTKEDQDREEIFYNETLAPDEVDHLLYPKVFTNAKRYTSSGVESTISFSEDDNLIIKGNNLLVLSSLLERYVGRIKCIYIDPPYFFKTNKNEDSFRYNPNFKLSSWLTFMKNRLEIAKKLLSDDGTIFIQIDDDGQAYLKTLCDEIFGVENFVNCICVKMSESSGLKMTHSSSRLPKLKEYILLYKKNNAKSLSLNEIRINKSRWDNEYKLIMTDISADDLAFLKSTIADEHRTKEEIRMCDDILNNASYCSLSEFYKKNGIISDEDKEKFNFDNAYRIFRTCALSSGVASDILETRKKKRKNIFFSYITKENKMYLIKGDFNEKTPKPRLQVAFADEHLSINPGDLWTDISTTGLDSEGYSNFKNGKKPERLIERILSLATNVGDIVLDFFSGSGTSAAVAHKMGRKYIGIEQMDSQIDMILNRLENVISGDSSGISKNYNWQGGGSFVYCELAQLNQNFVEEIKTAKDDETLQDLYDKIIDSGFVSYKLDISEINNNLDDYKKLSLSDKKRFLMKILDKNLLYVNYCDIDDEEFNISEDDKRFTESFYGGK